MHIFSLLILLYVTITAAAFFIDLGSILKFELNMITSGDLCQMLNDPGENKLKPVRQILYGDFNVILTLYKKKIASDNFIIYPDGLLVSKIIKLKYNIKLKNEVSTDLQYRVLECADRKKLRVGFLGDNEAVLDVIKQKLKQKYPGVNPVCYINGYQTSDKIFEDVKKMKGNIIFVGLGTGRQEEWLSKYGDKLDFDLVIACGGWFRYLSGTKKRAPAWILRIKLEWLYKTITEFSRVWRRYIIFSVHFSFLVLTDKISFVINENSPG